MKVNALKSFWVRLSPLSTTVLFVIASLVSLFGPMVPSASAAMIWEDIPVTRGTAPITSSIVPRNANSIFSTGSSSSDTINLSAYSSYKLSFDYVNQNIGATSLDLYYIQTASNGLYIGSFVKYGDAYPISASSGHVEASFSASVAAGNRLRLDILHGTGDGGNSYVPGDYSNRLDLSNIRLQGLKDNGVAAVPAAPTLASPVPGATIGYSATQDSSALLSFNTAESVAITQIQITGDFKAKVNGGVASRTLNGGSYGSSQTLTYFASEDATYNWVPDKTYTWRARASFSNISYTDSTGWGPWSEARSFTVTSVPVTPQPPATPILMSPVDNADLYTQYPQLVWKYMNNVEEYTIELAKDDEFSDIVWSATHNISLSAGTDDHFHTITGFPFENDMPYYWRVKASNDHGESDWSTAHSFTVRALSAPGIPEQVAPVDGSTVSSTTPTFSWTAVNDAATYRLRCI